MERIATAETLLSQFEHDSWFQATTLAERIALRRQMTFPFPVLPFDENFAQYQWDRWREQFPFDDNTIFLQRLALEGVSPDEFRVVLGASPAALHDNSTPDWLVTLQSAFSRYSADNQNFIQGLLRLIAPLLQNAYHRLEASSAALLSSTNPLFDTAQVMQQAFPYLVSRTTTMLARTVTLELNIARLRGDLTGATAQERFQDFIARLGNKDIALAILQEYPVLARQLVIATQQWHDTVLEFLQRLATDFSEVQAQFSSNVPLGKVKGLELGAGDTHANGRSVIIAEFESGVKLVYKPKSLAVDKHFQELLTWCNEQGVSPQFRPLQVLNKHTHGWVEFVVHHPCATEDALRRFYQRQGAYLALLYVLNATDFHAENVIAMGEHPMLIDLEALFHPRLRFTLDGAAEREAYRAMVESVLRVGLLPRRTWGKSEGKGIDISGLGAESGQALPYNTPRWEGGGTDEMRFTRTGTMTLEAQNRPVIEGKRVDVLAYVDEIATGFANAYQLLLTHRDALGALDGPLARFADDEIRVILRPTRTYATLNYESFHPDVLRNALDRARFFDRLWIGIEYRPQFDSVIREEVQDLEQADIPMFTSTASSPMVYSTRGVSLPSIIDKTGMQLVQEHLADLSAADLERQQWIIRASFASLWRDDTPLHRPFPVQVPLPLPPTSTEALIAEARKVGNRLAQLVYRGTSGDTAWIGMTVTNDRQWHMNPVGLDLYDGLPGIALFLAYLGYITQDDNYTALARNTVAAIQRQTIAIRGQFPHIGAFSGWAGLMYLYLHLGTLWQEPKWWDDAVPFADEIERLIAKDDTLDIIAGVAGVIPVLLAFHKQHPAPRLLEVAIACGTHLVERARPQAVGVAWEAPFLTFHPLTGFSHGTAGMAWSLYQLAAATQIETFSECAAAALAYEQHQREPSGRNWPDWRNFTENSESPPPATPPDIWAWCHGAPGIGLSRLDLLPIVAEEKLHDDIQVALDGTAHHGFGGNHSLCHGDAGNLDLFVVAAGVPGYAVAASATRDYLAAQLLASMRRNGYLCGTPLSVETPGLMTGIAGTGYMLLRLACPDLVPSVLLLQPPLLGG